MSKAFDEAKIELDKAHAEQVRFYNRAFQAANQRPMEVEPPASATPTRSAEASDSEEERAKKDRQDNDGPYIEEVPSEGEKDKGEDGKTEKEKEKAAKAKVDKQQKQAARGTRSASQASIRNIVIKGSGDSSSHKAGKSSSSGTDGQQLVVKEKVRMDTDEKQYIMRCARQSELLADSNYYQTLEHILNKYGIKVQALTEAIQSQNTKFFDDIEEKSRAT